MIDIYNHNIFMIIIIKLILYVANRQNIIKLEIFNK